VCIYSMLWFHNMGVLGPSVSNMPKTIFHIHFCSEHSEKSVHGTMNENLFFEAQTYFALTCDLLGGPGQTERQPFNIE
jgi:hypothetical protein